MATIDMTKETPQPRVLITPNDAAFMHELGKTCSYEELVHYIQRVLRMRKWTTENRVNLVMALIDGFIFKDPDA